MADQSPPSLSEGTFPSYLRRWLTYVARQITEFHRSQGQLQAMVAQWDLKLDRLLDHRDCKLDQMMDQRDLKVRQLIDRVDQLMDMMTQLLKIQNDTKLLVTLPQLCTGVKESLAQLNSLEMQRAEKFDQLTEKVDGIKIDIMDLYDSHMEYWRIVGPAASRSTPLTPPASSVPAPNDFSDMPDDLLDPASHQASSSLSNHPMASQSYSQYASSEQPQGHPSAPPDHSATQYSRSRPLAEASHWQGGHTSNQPVHGTTQPPDTPPHTQKNKSQHSMPQMQCNWMTNPKASSSWGCPSPGTNSAAGQPMGHQEWPRKNESQLHAARPADPLPPSKSAICNSSPSPTISSAQSMTHANMSPSNQHNDTQSRRQKPRHHSNHESSQRPDIYDVQYAGSTAFQGRLSPGDPSYGSQTETLLKSIPQFLGTVADERDLWRPPGRSPPYHMRPLDFGPPT